MQKAFMILIFSLKDTVFTMNGLWERYTKGLIKQEELRWKRMWLTLLDFKICDETLSKQLAEQFLERLPLKKNLFPYTLEILEYLTAKEYRLHLLSLTGKKDNGLKINNTTSNLAHYKIEEQVRGKIGRASCRER